MEILQEIPLTYRTINAYKPLLKNIDSHCSVVGLRDQREALSSNLIDMCM